MIFYFTGTGNSLYVAKKIQESEGGELIDMGIALNEKKFHYKIEKGEKIGLVFPVYFMGLPPIVAEFVKQLNLETNETPFIYTVITCAVLVGNADKDLTKLFESKNLQLNSSYSVKMPDNYVMVFENIIATMIAGHYYGKDINSALDTAEKQIEELIESVKKEEKGYFAKQGFAPIPTFSSLYYGFYGIIRNTKKFYATEKCTNCGQCERVCPSKVIQMKDGKPVWIKEKCSHCTACINRCPSQGIEYGKSTKKRERYLNPYIKFKDHENKSEFEV